MEREVVLVALLTLANVTLAKKDSVFVWRRPTWVMPWLKGPNMCAVEEVVGTREKYYSECMTYQPRTVCGKPTYIRYHCCFGFEKSAADPKGCQAVKPLDNIMETAEHLYLKDFVNHAKKSGVNKILTTGGAYTVFAPENKAFRLVHKHTRNRFNLNAERDKKESLLLQHVVKDRWLTTDIRNGQKLQSLYRKGAPIRINRYNSGITTANCARLVIPNQEATNGIIHVTEKVVEPIDKKGNIMEILLQDGRFGELVTALIVTGLGNELRSDRSFTLFAPTDKAFRDGPKEVVQRILGDKDMLKKLLKYHVIEEKEICSAALLTSSTMETMQGEKLNISCSRDNHLTVNGAKTAEEDILARNGIIHAVDTIMIPSAVKSLKEVASELKLNRFLNYAKNSGVDKLWTSTTKENYTLFIPGDSAFDKLPASQRQFLETNPQAMARVMKYHMAKGKVTTKSVVDQESLKSESSPGVNGPTANIRITVTKSKHFNANGAKVLSSDHSAGNSVIHVIDRVIMPPDGTILEEIKAYANLGQFWSYIKDSDSAALMKRLSSTNTSYTVFAPTNDAFASMESSYLEMLVNDQEQLLKFLHYHIIPRPIYTTGMETRLHYRFQSLTGDWIDLKRESEEKPIKVNQNARVIHADLEGTNGLVHVIDSVLKCPCLKKLGTLGTN